MHLSTVPIESWDDITATANQRKTMKRHNKSKYLMHQYLSQGCS
uniref:Uncharacterized protein n=1 Tax=Arundo donax TaxID=35708 RepID=A0A0A9CRA5_ARUDO